MTNSPSILRHLFLASVISLAITSAAGSAAAQTSVTDGSTPLALSPGAPAGSYALSGFESVNAYNGNLSFHLPLLRIGGRGEAGYTLSLPIERHWRVLHKSNDNQMIELPVSNLWMASGPRYGAGRLEGRTITDGACTPHYGIRILTRLTFTAPDGTEFELRDQLTGGQPQNYYCGVGQQYPSRGTVFVTVDGSAASFISDTTIRDDAGATNPSGYLSMRDGMRYRIDAGNVTWLRDRNGNKVVFTPGFGSMTVTDSLNRQVVIQYADYQTTFFDQINFNGFGGAPRSIRVNYAPLHTALRTDRPGDPSTIQTAAALFPQLTGSNSTLVDSYVVSSVVLPDEIQQFQFLYNVYGELARVTLPTGGAFEYDFGSGATMADVSGVFWNAFSQPEIFRRVLRRRTYLDSGSTLESLTTYGRPDVDLAGYMEINHYKNDQTTLIARERHYFHGLPGNSFSQGPLDYPAWRDGHEYQTEYYDADGQTLLKKTAQTWDQRGLYWWTGNPDNAPPNNPFVKETITTLADSGQVSKTTHVNPQTGQTMIDQFNNVTDAWVYDYGPGSPGNLLNHTHTDYLTINNGVDYTIRNSISSPHLLSLPTRQSTYDANEIERARTSFEYDNYGSADNFHATLKDWPALTGFAIFGLDSSFSSSYPARGNVTATSRYLLANNQVTGSITGYAQYDLAGNVVKTIDPRSSPGNIIASTISYVDCFGAPDTEARTNSVPDRLASVNQRSFALPTVITNALGQSIYTQFDYYLGRPVNVEDANGTVFSGYYNDALDRPSRILRASNRDATLQSQSRFTYDDAGHSVTTTSDLYSFGDHTLKNQVSYDGLGRTVETRQFESGDNYIAMRRLYDALDRVYQSSNPFRPWKNESPVWTTSGFDGLNRVVSQTTADGATASTSYNGNTVTVTDQIGKKKKSVSDALGRLTQVYEDPNGVNWLTSYAYDALGDLITVTQGGQMRTFVYDSLSRLTSSNNPENGTITNTFDNGGNLRTRTDARGVITTLDYDALNRPTSKTYQNAPGGGARVSYFYDSQSLPSGAPSNFLRGSSTGRLVAVTYGNNASAGDYYGYDALGRSVVKVQQTGDTNYESSAAYLVSGRVGTLTYPSGRTLTFNYDQAGRLGDKDVQNPAMAGNLGDGVTRNYSSGIAYSSWNSLAQEKFGTDTPVYNKLFYNSRGQLAEIRESTSPNNTSWNRGAIINNYSNLCWGMCAGQSMSDNNGNLKRQDTYIPNNDQVTSYATWADAFSYDDLNRLTQVHEYTGNTNFDWQQEYVYDRWGNRTIQQNNTWGAGIPKPDLSVNPANNRLNAPPGFVMSYDAAGNLTNDNYSGQGQRTYDGESRMTQAWANNQWQTYGYDGNGARVRRNINNVETWQVYGISGELLAEYAANDSPTAPQKEYGYRSGQLLITAAGSTRTNVALAANGAVASASSAQDAGRGAAAAINGDRKGIHWGTDATTGSGWNNGTTALPAWLQVDFNGSKTINEIDLYAPQDNYTNPTEPTTAMTFSLYGLSGFDLQYWNGSAWVTIPGCSVSGNNKIWRQFSFAAITTNKIRVLTNASPDSYSRLTEIEAWSAAAPVPVRSNMALAVNGAVATASSQQDAGRGPAAAINGDRKGLHWGTDAATGSGWNNGVTALPAWLQVDFSGSKTIDEIDLFAPQDNYTSPIEPTTAMTFSLYGLSGFDLQYWNGSAWVTIPGCSVSGNNKVWRQFSFAAITTSKIRVLTSASPDSYSRMTEIEAWGTTGSSSPAQSDIEWLVTDQLGTPRMVFDKTGSLSNTKRHDYLPFGEDLPAGVGQRNSLQGFGMADGVRQKFTQKERDSETGLDYFLARYYSSTQGRFTSVDPLLASGRPANPQSWNRYAYVLNNPLHFVDPNGLVETSDPQNGDQAQAPKTIKPPQELIAAILEDLTQVIMMNSGQDIGTGVMQLDQQISDQVIGAITDAYTRGIETGTQTAASSGIAIPSQLGTQSSVGGSATVGTTAGLPNGSASVNLGRTAQKTFEPASGQAVRTDIANREANGQTVERVTGTLQDVQVTVNTRSGTTTAVAEASFWRERLTKFVDQMYSAGIEQGKRNVAPPHVVPKKPLF
ncbi:MAG: hypothetical protein JWM21_4957 [Acidobacteria bacterium]|nr:hypothetical protein [Acidobacteriota bacterium]